MTTRKGTLQAGVAALGVLVAGGAQAAEPVYLFLRLNGTDVQGESGVSSQGRANAIRCELFRTSLRQVEGATPMAQGGQVVCRKPIDKASPLLVQGLVLNHVAVATFRFYRPSPTGDGTTEQHYTVSGRNGKVVSLKQLSPDASATGQVDVPAQEEVTFSFPTLTFLYTSGGVEAVWP